MSMLTVGTAYPEDSGVFTCQISLNGENALSSGSLTVAGGNPNSVTTGQKVPKEVFQQKPQSVITINGGQKITVDREQADALRKSQGKSGIVMGGSMMDNVLNPQQQQQQQQKPQPPVPSKSQFQPAKFQPQQFQPQQAQQSSQITQNLPPLPSKNAPPPVQAPKPTNFKPVSFKPGSAPPKPPSKPAFANNVYNPAANNSNPPKPNIPPQNIPSQPVPPPVTRSVKPPAPKQNNPVNTVKAPIQNTQISSRPEPISVNDAETEKLSNIQTHLSSQPPVFEDQADAEFEEVDDSQLAEPQIHESLYHMKLPQGAPLNLKILSSGCPIPKCFWFKEGRQISKRSKHFMINTEPGNGNVTFNLSVPQTCAQDDGIYSCVVISPAGLAISTARIKLFKPDDFVEENNSGMMNVINQPMSNLSINPAPASIQGSATVSGLASSSNMSNPKTNDSIQTANHEAEIEEEENEEEFGEEAVQIEKLVDDEEIEIEQELKVEAFEVNEQPVGLPEGVPEFHKSPIQSPKYSFSNLNTNPSQSHTYNPSQNMNHTYNPQPAPQQQPQSDQQAINLLTGHNPIA